MRFYKRFLYHKHFLGVHDKRSDAEVFAETGYRPRRPNIERRKKANMKPETLK